MERAGQRGFRVKNLSKYSTCLMNLSGLCGWAVIFFVKMSENNLTYGGIRGALLSAFPELLEPIWSAFGSYYDLEKGTPEETPEAYPVFEDVVQKLVFELLESGQDENLVARFFLFFEDMANSSDLNVSRDLLGIAILEPLVYRKASLRAAWRFMGPKMRQFAAIEAVQQGRQENLPPK
jgi:hypothetical protein